MRLIFSRFGPSGPPIARFVSAIPAIPQQGAITPLGALFYTDISVRYPVLQHIARYLCQKNPRAHKIKSALPPQKKPKILKGGILRTWVFLQKERIFPGAHKIGAAISGPSIADKKIYGHEDQEWPRQTKPKKGQFMNFSQGHSGTKVQCESCLSSQGKNTRIHKKSEIHELFVLALSLVWFAGATPERIFLILVRYPQENKHEIPSDRKLLLTKNYSETIVFGKLRISYAIPWKTPSRNPLKIITKNEFSGNYFRNNFVSEGSFAILPLIFSYFFFVFPGLRGFRIL